MTLATTTSAPDLLRHAYEQMVLIRAFETEAERQYKADHIGGYCHVASGQEAVIVGAMHALEDDDLLVTGYRCRGFALTRGVSPEAVMAELFGRRHGAAHGRGGSMHLLDVERGFFGGWGIVAGQLPVAVGRARALQARLRVSNARRARRWRRLRRRGRERGAPAAPRPRQARAGRPGSDDLPLSRPFGGRRRTQLPHQGRDRRVEGKGPHRAAARAPGRPRHVRRRADRAGARGRRAR